MLPNLHPPLTSFPLALFSTALFLEIGYLFFKNDKIQFSIVVIVGLAAFFSILTFVSGYQGIEFVSENHIELRRVELETHQFFGRILLFLGVCTFGLKLAEMGAKFNVAMFRWCYRVALVLTNVIVVYTSYLGGQLVFRYGFGVQ